MRADTSVVSPLERERLSLLRPRVRISHSQSLRPSANLPGLNDKKNKDKKTFSGVFFLFSSVAVSVRLVFLFSFATISSEEISRGSKTMGMTNSNSGPQQR